MQMVAYKNQKTKSKSGLLRYLVYLNLPFCEGILVYWVGAWLLSGALQKEIDGYRINNYGNTQMKNTLYGSASTTSVFCSSHGSNDRFFPRGGL
jgi:hypothetical protein